MHSVGQTELYNTILLYHIKDRTKEMLLCIGCPADITSIYCLVCAGNGWRVEVPYLVHRVRIISGAVAEEEGLQVYIATEDNQSINSSTR